ncbi:MAG: hypothetical protein OXB98_15130 [Bryobacterales bacterium]|nr:hypothetical protein [Bryobacterales bacterium]
MTDTSSHVTANELKLQQRESKVTFVAQAGRTAVRGEGVKGETR